MNSSFKGQTNQLLGYPADARLLIINGDDFGMCHAVNQAIIGSFAHGVLRSATLMAPCPWALHAIHFLANHPETPFGIHLTVISDWVDYRWGPITTPREQVPNLINETSTFYNFDWMPHFLAQVELSEWAVHPGLDTPELLAIEKESNHIRQSDFDFLTSQ